MYRVLKTCYSRVIIGYYQDTIKALKAGAGEKCTSITSSILAHERYSNNRVIALNFITKMGRNIRHSRNTLIKTRRKVGKDEIKTSGNVPNPAPRATRWDTWVGWHIAPNHLFLEDHPNEGRPLRKVELREISNFNKNGERGAFSAWKTRNRHIGKSP